MTEAGRAELAAAAKSSFVALRPEDAQMSFDQAFGPDGGRPTAGRWDTFALTMSGADALLWCTIAWARATPGPHADALPLPSGVQRPADMVRTRWMAAFTQREAPAVRELLRERLMAVGEAELKQRTSKREFPGSLLLFQDAARELSAASLDELFGRLLTHFHAPPDGLALHTYLRRWLEDRISVMSGHLNKRREGRTRAALRATLSVGVRRLDSWLAPHLADTDGRGHENPPLRGSKRGR